MKKFQSNIVAFPKHLNNRFSHLKMTKFQIILVSNPKFILIIFRTTEGQKGIDGISNEIHARTTLFRYIKTDILKA